MKVILTFLYMVMGILAFAQQGNNIEPQSLLEDQLLNQLNQFSNLIFKPDAESRNVLQIHQKGNSNQAIINQVNTNLYSPNEVFLLQKGNSNKVQIDMSGGDNIGEVIQNGSQNEYNLNLNGKKIETRVLQKGDNNEIYQRLEGNSLDFVLIQEGSNNSIIQFENSTQTDAPAYQIRQQGNGMNIYIQNSTIY